MTIGCKKYKANTAREEKVNKIPGPTGRWTWCNKKSRCFSKDPKGTYSSAVYLLMVLKDVNCQQWNAGNVWSLEVDTSYHMVYDALPPRSGHVTNMETLCQGKQPTEAVDSVDRFITNQSPLENSWFSFGNCENSKEVLTFPLTTSLACTCLGVHHKLTTESLCFTRVYVTLLQKKTYIVCIYTCMHTHTAYCTYIIIYYIYIHICVCVCAYACT